MLRYLGTGFRQFGLYPITPHPRLNWEFFAVVKGRCAALNPGEKPSRLVERTLWVSPPHSQHTWAGDGSRAAQVTVFHFGSVPVALERAVRERGRLVVPLTAPECQRLATLARQVQDDFHSPNELSQLVFQCLLLELSLLALRKLPHGRWPQNRDKADQIVAAATAWFTEHIGANPTIDEVARQVHVSPSTLRRYFQQAMRERPVRVFRRIQIEHGMRLMTETTHKLEIVAEQCGFTSTSDFCRAFKAHAKVSPNTWRRTLLAPPRGATEVEPAPRPGRGRTAAAAAAPSRLRPAVT
jgi:AraC family transcriptional regulator